MNSTSNRLLNYHNGTTQSCFDKWEVILERLLNWIYDVGETNPWTPGSDWMPYGLPVLKTMAKSEAFAKKVRPGSILAKINITDLPSEHLQEPAKLIYNGRLAVSHDGNIHDEDDWGALAFVWGIVASFGMQEKLVHVDHSNHLVDNTARG